METLLKKMKKSCLQYREGELDDVGFRQLIHNIPEDLWKTEDTALSMVKVLVENEDLYAVSLKTPMIYAAFICDLLPQTFRQNQDFMLATAEIISDFMKEYCDSVSCYDLDAVFSALPQTVWEDEKFVTAAANMVIERAYLMDDLCCVSQVIPPSVWQTEKDLRWVVLRFFEEDERNMNTLSLFPEKVWSSNRIVCLILSCLQEALENDRARGTVYSNFSGDNRYHLERFLSYLSAEKKSDIGLIEEILSFGYFEDAFEVLFDWIDESLWSDKAFVLQALEADLGAMQRVSAALQEDERFEIE